jgi:hypothetical protein
LARIEREHIGTLKDGLNDVYDAYRRMGEFLNELAASGGFDPETYTIEISEKQRQKMADLLADELLSIERVVREFKALLATLSSANAVKQ